MKQQGRPQRKRMRLTGWDYSRPGAYFVTICTHNWKPIFARRKVQAVIESWWLKVEDKNKHACIDEYVVMPDHMHGIIILNEHAYEPTEVSVGRIVQWFKTMTTNAYIHGVRNDGWSPFSGRLWQRGFYDRVIRNDKELNRIRGYIRTNPDKLPGMG